MQLILYSNRYKQIILLLFGLGKEYSLATQHSYNETLPEFVEMQI